MSKKLAKILSICALAVLMPFIIVGSALTFTQAVGVTLSIAQAGINSTLGLADPTVAIVMDSKVQEGNTVEVKKNTSVDLSFDGEGYYFHGWYEGNAAEIDIAKDDPLADGAEDIKGYVVTGNTVLTAMRDVQTYNVVYSGKDASGNDVSLEADNGIEYGATLKDLPSTANKIFAGWTVKDSTKPATFVAKFDATTQAQSVELVPVWKENAAYTVYYSIVDKSAANAISMTYSISTGFPAYTQTREGYNFVGLTAGNTGKVYVYDISLKDYVSNGEKLSDVLIRDTAAEVCAVWESIYSNVRINFSAKASYSREINGVKVVNDWLLVDEQGKTIETIPNETLNNPNSTTFVEYLIEDSLNEALHIDHNDNFLSYFLGDYGTIKTAEGQNVEFTGTIKIVPEGKENGYNIPMAETYTFGEVLESLTGKYGADLSSMQINVIFMYEVVNAG